MAPLARRRNEGVEGQQLPACTKACQRQRAPTKLTKPNVEDQGVEGLCQHASAFVSIRQHTSAYVSIRQHTFLCHKQDSSDDKEHDVPRKEIVEIETDDSRPYRLN